MASIDNQSPGEFDLIGKHFTRHSHLNDAAIMLGVGDDCALLQAPSPGTVLAVTTDMLVEDRHFFKDVDPAKLGHKALAVNLSDLAAMGAKPIAFTLSLSLPTNKASNPTWLEEFSKGLYALADHHQCRLIGGDTTAGPLNISITAFGEVPPNEAMRRDRALPGDDIWVSHQLGEARWALGHLRGEWRIDEKTFAATRLRLELPTPRVELGLKLRTLAHAAIDISDGLLGDLRHILQASHLDATVWIDQVPVSKALANQSIELQRLCSLRGGDDYELCFTAKQENRLAIEAVGKSLGISLTRIGKTSALSTASPEIQLMDADNLRIDSELAKQYFKSFDHFK